MNRGDAAINITRADFHGEWNYTIQPSNRSKISVHLTIPKVIVAAAEGCGPIEIMRRSGLSKPGVRRCRHSGCDFLLTQWRHARSAKRSTHWQIEGLATARAWP